MQLRYIDTPPIHLYPVGSTCVQTKAWQKLTALQSVQSSWNAIFAAQAWAEPIVEQSRIIRNSGERDWKARRWRPPSSAATSWSFRSFHGFAVTTFIICARPMAPMGHGSSYESWSQSFNDMFSALIWLGRINNNKYKYSNRYFLALSIVRYCKYTYILTRLPLTYPMPDIDWDQGIVLNFLSSSRRSQ